jgi:hypothetical protein
MSTREKRKTNKKRARGQDPGPITRRQQVAAIRQIKGNEIASAVAERIREAVKDEVDRQLKPLKDTMFDLIDRVAELEGTALAPDTEPTNDLKFHCNKCGWIGDKEGHAGCSYLAVPVPVLRKINDERDSDDRPERAEGTEVLEVDEVVPDEGLEREDRDGEDGAEGSQGG